MPRNPLAPLRSTAAVIAETRLKDADVSPADRVRVGRAIAAAMTPAERAQMARNDLRDASMAIRMAVSDIAVNGPQAVAEQRSAYHGYAAPSTCPQCGTEARGSSDDARGEWFASHYNGMHPERVRDMG